MDIMLFCLKKLRWQTKGLRYRYGLASHDFAVAHLPLVAMFEVGGVVLQTSSLQGSGASPQFETT